MLIDKWDIDKENITYIPRNLLFKYILLDFEILVVIQLLLNIQFKLMIIYQTTEELTFLYISRTWHVSEKAPRRFPSTSLPTNLSASPLVPLFPFVGHYLLTQGIPVRTRVLWLWECISLKPRNLPQKFLKCQLCTWKYSNDIFTLIQIIQNIIVPF